MRIAVASEGKELTDPVARQFGRAPYFIVYDTDGDVSETLSNAENADAAHGAGIQAAQLVVRQNVQAVVSGKIGPKAYEVLRAARIQMTAWADGSVRDAITMVTTGSSEVLDGPTNRGHSG